VPSHFGGDIVTALGEASTAEKRAWLRDNGYDPGRNGVLSPDLVAAYDAAHADANGDSDPYLFVNDVVTPDPPDPETRPRRQPRAATPRLARLNPWAKPKRARKKKAAPKRERVPVDEILSGAWRLMARVARPVPPLERVLKLQSPVAGALLEDSVKGTMADTLLQPLARMQEQGKTVAALVGPPVLVTAGALYMQRCMQAKQAPNPVVVATLHEMLRESLMVWMDVAGPKFEAALSRERDFEEKYGQSVDDTIDWIFSPPPNPADEEAVKAEETAIRRAQGVLADDAP
jgi:hypothetical protein